MGGRPKDSVQIDKYALNNVLCANETSAKEVSLMMGHSGNYLSQIISGGGYIKRNDFENLKGLLRITDNDIVKAVPVQRSEEVENIYSAYPVKKKAAFELTEENKKFIDLVSLLSGEDNTRIINGIICHFVQHSNLAMHLYEAIDAIKAIC